METRKKLDIRDICQGNSDSLEDLTNNGKVYK